RCMTSPAHTVTYTLSLHAALPILGINRGRLGFLTDILPSEIESRVGQVLDGDYHIEPRFLLDLEVRRGKTVVGEGSALNDVVLLDRKSTRLNSSHVKIAYAVFCLK